MCFPQVLDAGSSAVGDSSAGTPAAAGGTVAHLHTRSAPKEEAVLEKIESVVTVEVLGYPEDEKEAGDDETEARKSYSRPDFARGGAVRLRPRFRW
jgi:hypothetical protein